MDQLIGLIATVVLLIIGYTAGTVAEKRHYRSIKERESEFLNLPVLTLKRTPGGNPPAQKAELVCGSVVISVDYFKRFLAALRNIFGGRVLSYESLVDRARREAILRMEDMASGADIILNVRIETSSVGKSANDRGSIGSIEALAYGTAVTFVKETA
jgi:uncharacterized protein YbjQ (UPF0145 family)